MYGTGNGLKYETSVCTMKLQVWKYEVKIFQITKYNIEILPRFYRNSDKVLKMCPANTWIKIRYWSYLNWIIWTQLWLNFSQINSLLIWARTGLSSWHVIGLVTSETSSFTWKDTVSPKAIDSSFAHFFWDIR